MKSRLLALKQLDRQLKPWLQIRANFQPRQGWVSRIRKALGMTLPQLAQRLGVTRSRVVKIQQAEISNALTLRTLKETANALGCDFVYALVPRKPLQVLIRDQAEKVARQKLQRVSHSMALEDQLVPALQQKEQLEELINDLLSGSRRQLWEDNP
jgi:predicted DNA-binding mobile mystery protein A